MKVLRQFLAGWKVRARGLDNRKGRLHVLPDVHSPQLGNTRDVLVFTPASYRRSSKHYPVIYMQDGQNLFDPATSFAGDWGLGEAVAWSARRGYEAIVVGLPNMGNARLDEYSPFVQEGRGGGLGDQYLDFVVDTVKPLVDKQFRTLPDAAHTGIAGSSMGALISQYAFFRRPDVFGFAAALSPAFWFGDAAILDFVRDARRSDGRLYLDIGLREGEGSVALARRMRDLLVQKGYHPGDTLRWVEDPGGTHHESDWGRRFRKALPFLLRNGAAA
ncbi:MAG TPA: alpha/beta hydrolase-fold protein [Gemmatimonadales bacterium]|jgi:predicted alpha/beta superfamily hydrolase